MENMRFDIYFFFILNYTSVACDFDFRLRNAVGLGTLSEKYNVCCFLNPRFKLAVDVFVISDGEKYSRNIFSIKFLLANVRV